MDHPKHIVSRIKSDAKKSTKSAEELSLKENFESSDDHRQMTSSDAKSSHPIEGSSSQESFESHQLTNENPTSKKSRINDLPVAIDTDSDPKSPHTASTGVDVMHNLPASKRHKSSMIDETAKTVAASSSSSIPKRSSEMSNTPILIDDIEYASRNDVFEGLIVNDYGKIDEGNEKNGFLMFDMVDKRMSKTITCTVQGNLAKMWAHKIRRNMHCILQYFGQREVTIEHPIKTKTHRGDVKYQIVIDAQTILTELEPWDAKLSWRFRSFTSIRDCHNLLVTRFTSTDISVVVVTVNKKRVSSNKTKITVADGVSEDDRTLLWIDEKFRKEFETIAERFSRGEIVLLYLKNVTKLFFTREKRTLPKLHTHPTTTWMSPYPQDRIEHLRRVHKECVKDRCQFFEVHGVFKPRNFEERPYKYTCAVCRSNEIHIIHRENLQGFCLQCKLKCELNRTPWIDGVIFDQNTGKDYFVQATGDNFHDLIEIDPNDVVEWYEDENTRDLLLDQISLIQTSSVFGFNAFGKFCGFDQILKVSIDIIDENNFFYDNFK
ncbi:hypothetical protein R1flu_006867 [Riccia fluitans]|uniref:Uncharacterized protein n=1 Tax=Riccia fluitans TaxID=41844 RepID=A0ABD1YX79_9MARC